MTGLRELLICFLVCSSLIVTFSLVYALYKKGAPAVKPFAFICGTVAVYLFGYAMELSSDTLDAMKAWNLIQYFGIPFIPAFWLWFALAYNDIPPIGKAWFRHALFIVPAATFLMRLTNEIHHLYYTEMVLHKDGIFPVMSLEKGFFYYIFVIFISVCLVCSNVIFIRSSFTGKGRRKTESRILIFGSSLPWIAVIFNGINLGNIGLDYSALIYPVSCILILVIVFQDQFLKLKPKARDFVFDNTDDAFLVFDTNGNLADFNLAASRLLAGIRVQPDSIPGSADSDSRNPLDMLARLVPGNLPIQIPVATGAEVRHFRVSASSIADISGRPLGKVVTLSDITQITDTLKTLAEKEEKLRTVTDSINEAFWLTNSSTGRYEYVSPAFERIWGRSAQELYDDPGVFLESVHSGDAAAVRAWSVSDRGDGPSDMEFRILGLSGEIRWVWIRSSPVRTSEGVLVRYAGIGVDITERKRMEERIETGDRILDAINRATSDLLISRNLKAAISGGLALVGEATGIDRVYLFENDWRAEHRRSVTTLSQEWNSDRFAPQIGNPLMKELPLGTIEPMIAELSAGRSFMAIVKNIPDDELRGILQAQSIKSILLLPIFTNNTLWGFIGFDDCSKDRTWTDPEISLLSTFSGAITKAIERSVYEQKIEFISFHDSLTGLFNRSWFDYVFRNPDIVDNLPLTVVMADVNGLKLTNDAFGHAAGDSLLCRAATVMHLECRASDIIARTGGDEFVILLPGTNSLEAAGIVARIRKRSESFRTETGMLSISFGWETRIDLTVSPDQVLKAAEDAMYRQKLSESLAMRHNTISVIMKTLYSKNNREQKHSERVARLCESFGRALGLDEEKVTELRQAGLMHDIGKIGVADSILAKKDAPDEAEWVQLKRHSEIGYRILCLVNEYARIASWVLSHHERWDGTGYPNGAAGADIPLQARILALVDAWDAMIYDRPYQPAIPRDRAIVEIKAGAGLQFDPGLIDIFLGVLEKTA